MHHTIFISDLHLSESEPKKNALFLEFLQETAPQADALYILGDLFEAWVGDDNKSKFNRTIIAALKTCAKTGLDIYFMRGNRDFLIGKKFATASGCKLLTDPCTIELYGKKIILTHGDILCTDDTSHIKFRKLAHNPKYNRFFLMLPLRLRQYIAKKIRTKSTKGKQQKSAAITDVTTTAVQKIFQDYNASLLIHGHTHAPAVHEVKVGEKSAERIVLGAWEQHATMLIYNSDHSYTNHIDK